MSFCNPNWVDSNSRIEAPAIATATEEGEFSVGMGKAIIGDPDGFGSGG